MKSTNGYDASGLPFVAGAPSRQTVSSAITVPEESTSARSSKTPSHSSTTCEPSVTLTKHSNTNSKLTGSTMTKDMNAVICDGQPEPSRISTKATHCESTTGMIKESCFQSLSLSIAAWACHVLRYCITKVSRWTRSLEGRAAEREARTEVPVYDIIEAGPRHRFWTVGVPCSNCVLGLGYGMGAAKFVDSCKSQGLDLPSTPVEEWPEMDRRLQFIIRNVARIPGDPYSERNRRKVGQLVNSLRIVNEWRRANQRIVDQWKYYESVFKQRIAAGKSTVAFRLPSGRVKRYFDPHLCKEETVEVDENGVEHPSFRVAIKATTVRGNPATFFTGGNIMENIVQASCRDIMAYSAVEIEKKHPTWKYVFSVYDEIVFEVPEQDAEEASIVIPQTMTFGDYIRDWTEGLALEVEGDVCDRYHK